MSIGSLSLPVGPQTVRVFCGYKLPSLSRDDFYKELGETFMPGTPYMQASLGLNAYLPAVLDLNSESGIPDEVALIVYASMRIYEEARAHSLRRRIYTHAHTAVFDMQAPGGGGQFPGPPSEPNQRGEHCCWYLNNRAVDWQAGTTRLLFLAAPSQREGLREDFLARSVQAGAALKAAGADQVIGLATNHYAAIWLHSPEPLNLPADLCGLKPDGVDLVRDLTATAVPMPNLEEGVQITEASMYCFRFVRDLRFHLESQA